MLKVVADKRRHLWELLSWVEVLAEGQGLFVWFNPKCKMKSKGLLLIYLLHLHRLHSLSILLTTVSTCSQNHKPSVLIFNLVSLLSLFLHEVSILGLILLSQAKHANIALCVNPEEGPHCDNALSLSSWEGWTEDVGKLISYSPAGRQRRPGGEQIPWLMDGSSVHGLGSPMLEKIKPGNQVWHPESRIWGRWLGQCLPAWGGGGRCPVLMSLKCWIWRFSQQQQKISWQCISFMQAVCLTRSLVFILQHLSPRFCFKRIKRSNFVCLQDAFKYV